jgi:Flp pilus assembly protein TadG
MAKTVPYVANNSGTAAVEFALVLPMFLTLLIGGFFAAFLLFTAGGLHYAVERAARCAKVQTSVCGNPTATQNYAQSQFSGYAVTPVFVASSAACGQQVSGSATFAMNIFVRTITIPLTATACYP